MISNNPNASTSLLSGIGGGSFVVWVLGTFGVHISTYAGVAVAGALSGIILFIGRNGFQGAIDRIRYGSAGKPPAPAAPAAPPGP
jgi:hypothetical protein